MPRGSRRTVWATRSCAIAVLLWAPSGTIAQEAPSFHSEVVQGIVHVLVLDWSGRAIDDLPREAFSLSLDGESVPVRVFLPPEATALEIALLVDHSRSLAAQAEMVRAGVTQLLDGLRPDDCVSILPFASRPGLWVRGPPADERLRTVVRGLFFDGETALFDALLEGLAHLAVLKLGLPEVPVAPPGLFGFQPLMERMARRLTTPVAPGSCAPTEGARDRRFALAVVTDGLDTASRSSVRDVLLGAATANVPILAAAPVAWSNNRRFDPARRARDRRQRSTAPRGGVLAPLPTNEPTYLLRRLTLASGGALFPADSLEDAYGRLVRGLQGHYMLGYPVTRSAAEGLTARRVRVEVDRSGTQVFHQASTYSDRLVGEAGAAAAMLRGLAILASYPDAALEEFDRALQSAPRLAGAHQGRGLALLALGDPQAAGDAFRSAIAIAPWLPAPHRVLADLSLQLGAPEIAWEHTIRAAHLDPLNRDLVSRMGTLVPPPFDLQARLAVPLVLLGAPVISDLRGQVVGLDALARVAVRIQSSPAVGLTTAPDVASFALELEIDPLDAKHPAAVEARLRLYDVGREELAAQRLLLPAGLDGVTAGAAIDRVMAALLEVVRREAAADGNVREEVE